MKGNVFVTAFIFIGLFSLFACNLETETEKGFIFDDETFNSKWNEWQNNNIQNYSFTMTGKLPSWNFSRAIDMQ